MANFIGLVYATLKAEGIDTAGMSTDEAVAKYNELQKQSGGKAGEKEPTPAENRKTNSSKIKTEENDPEIRKINKPIDEANAQRAKEYAGDKGLVDRFKNAIENDPEFVKLIKQYFGTSKENERLEEKGYTFKKNTKNGDQIVNKYQQDGETHIIAKAEDGSFVVGYNYNEDKGTFENSAKFSSMKEAEQAFRKNNPNARLTEQNLSKGKKQSLVDTEKIDKTVSKLK